MKHENCVPFLATSKGSETSKTDAKLRKLEILNVNIIPRTKEKKKLVESIKESLQEKAKHMEDLKAPILRDLQRKAEIKTELER